MAKEQEQKENNETDKAKASGKGGMFVWIVSGVVVLAGATGGFALSQLLGSTTPSADPNAPAAEVVPQEKFDPLKVTQPGQKRWIYDKMDPIVANLDEPGVSRFVRVTVMLEMSEQMDAVNGAVFLDEKKVILQDWMTTYLAGLSLEDVRGSRSLTRIKQEVHEQFNRILFSDGKPFIERVLFKEFAVQ